jgi:hypothetical protein
VQGCLAMSVPRPKRVNGHGQADGWAGHRGLAGGVCNIEKSGEPSDAAWRSGGFDGTTRQGQGKILDFPAVWRLPPQKRTLARRTVVKPPFLQGP